MECYQSIARVAKELGLNRRRGKEYVLSKAEPVYVVTSKGNTKLVGYCKPIGKAYAVPKLEYERFVEWRDSKVG